MSLVSLARVAAGTSYFVRPDGYDGNEGTSQRRAWRTIERVNAAVFAPGDTIAFEAGETFTGTLVLTHSGTGTDRIEVTSFVVDGASAERAIIDGGADASILLCGDYVTIRNLDCVGDGRLGGNTADGIDASNSDFLIVDQVEVSGFQHSGVRVADSSNVVLTRIDAHDNGFAGIFFAGYTGTDVANPARYSNTLYIGHCNAWNNPGDPTVLDNHSGNGILLGWVDGATVEYCTATNNGWDMPRGGNGPVGIWCFQSDHVTIQYCIAYRNRTSANGRDGGGFDLDGGVRFSTIQYCLSYENEGAGYGVFQFEGASEWRDNTIRYCISHSDGSKFPSAGFHLWDGSDSGTFSGFTASNNLVFNEGLAVYSVDGCPETLFVNNLFLFGADFTNDGRYPNHNYKGNLYWKTAGGFSSEGFTDFEAWVAHFGEEIIGGTIVGINADPRLRDVLTVPDLTDPAQLATLTQFMLEAASYARDTGLDLETNGAVAPASTDFFGTPLYKGLRIDRGVHESAAPLLRVLPGAGVVSVEASNLPSAPGILHSLWSTPDLQNVRWEHEADVSATTQESWAFDLTDRQFFRLESSVETVVDP